MTFINGRIGGLSLWKSAAPLGVVGWSKHLQNAIVPDGALQLHFRLGS